MWWPWLLVQDGWYTEENPEVVLGRSLSSPAFPPGYRSDNACSRRTCAWERGLCRVLMLQPPLWSSGTQSACLKVMFVIRKANTPWCGPLHCVHSISSGGSPETPVSDGYDTTPYDDESLRPWDGALRGTLLFGLSGRRGEPLFS